MHQRVAIDGCRMLCSHVDCRVPIDTHRTLHICALVDCRLVDCIFPIDASRIYAHL